MRSLLISLIILFAVTSCEQDNTGTTQAATTMGGAAAGGVVGNQFGKGGGNVALTVSGILLGAWAGDRIGAALNDSDRAHDKVAEKRAFTAPVGQQVTWNNPETQASGAITPVHDGYAPSGAYCRDFHQSLSVGGQQKQGNVTACQQADGSWKASK